MKQTVSVFEEEKKMSPTLKSLLKIHTLDDVAVHRHCEMCNGSGNPVCGGCEACNLGGRIERG